MPDEDKRAERIWRLVLSGGIVVRGQRRLFRLLPATRRCKNCLAPLEGGGARVARVLGRAPYSRNPRFCTF